MKLDREIVESLIGYKFKAVDILVTAFTHSSCRKTGANKSYERIEFLGDSILGFAIAEYLVENFPNLNEGDMSTFRASIVDKKSLSEITYKLGLGKLKDPKEGIAQFMSFGNGNYKTLLNDKIRCDLFESIIGAIYLDSLDYKVVRTSVYYLLKEYMNAEDIMSNNKDSKSMLQEYCAKLGSVPEYKLINENGPDHAPTFMVEVIINGKSYAVGQAKSKKLAEQKVASIALNLIQSEQ